MKRARKTTELPPLPDLPEKELRALHALSEAINRGDTTDAVYPEAIGALRWITGAERAAVLMLDQGDAMRFVAWDGLSDAYRAAVGGHSPWAAREARAEPLVVLDAGREPALAALLPALKSEGIASLAFVPIAHQGRLYGMFMLCFEAPFAPSAEQMRFSLTAAEYLALAVSRQRALEEVRQLNAGLEERVRRRTLQLENANREMEAFCYSVSHDLRAPLRALDGFARILIEDAGHALDEVDRSNLHRIISASERMGRLMDDLLKLSRIGRASMRLAAVDLGALAGAIVEGLGKTEPQRSFSWLIDDGLTVRADTGLMRIALENLIGNAWKYTSRNASSCIEFGKLDEAGRSAYFVRDNGAGFDMRYAGKLFSPFQRVHSPGEYEGNGIGLAIVQRILLRHGGRVWAESEPGRGSTFWFTLWEGGIPADLLGPASFPPCAPSA